MTARGFAQVAANKMLVMIDGRTVYSPLLTGEEIDQRLPDVVLSDVGMPREDGYDLIRQLRRRDAQRGGGYPQSPSRRMRVS